MVVNNKYIIKLLVFTTLFISACKVDVGTNESEQFKVIPMTGEVSFELLKNSILNPQCVRCHAWANDELQIGQRIVQGNPDASSLFSSVKSGKMPPSGALSFKQISLIERYILNIKEVKSLPLTSTFKSIEFHLINRSCLSCHNNKSEEISFEGFKNVKKHANEIIDILDLGEIQDQPMPPRDEQGKPKAPVPSSEIVEAFREWIKLGKLDN